MSNKRVKGKLKFLTQPYIWGLAGLGAIGLIVSGCDNNKETATKKADIPEYKVIILEHACDPMTMEINAGKVRFLIENKSNRAVEWEILKDVRIIAERENIPPGFTQKLTVTLDPDNYEITCGLLSNPRGVLTVNAANNISYNRPPTPIEMVNVAGEYNVYIITELKALLAQAQQLDLAIKAGDVAQAQSLYVTTLQHYEHIEPVMKTFSDLDNAIAADETLFKDKTQDPQFKGFHRIEWGLFANQSTAGLDAIADQLVNNIQLLQQAVDQFNLPPEKIIDYATSLINEILENKLNGNKSLYAHSELWSIQANMDGFNRISRLLTPLVNKADPTISQNINEQSQTIFAILDKNKVNNVFIDYRQVSDNDKNALKQAATKLSELLSTLPAALGLE